MILYVTKVQSIDQEKKPTTFKVTMKGTDNNFVTMSLTIECESKMDIQKYVPLMIGERRLLDFGLLDHTLSDYETEDMAKHEQEMKDDIATQEQRRRDLLEDGV